MNKSIPAIKDLRVNKRHIYVSKCVQYDVGAKIMLHLVCFVITKERTVTLLRMRGGMDRLHCRGGHETDP